MLKIDIALVCVGIFLIGSSKLYGGDDAGVAHEDLVVEQSEKWDISVEVSKQSVLVAEPLTVEISVANVSTEDCKLVETNTIKDYLVSVYDAEGKKTPLTRFGKRCRDARGAYGRIVRSIAPGKTVKNKIVVSRLYDMTIAEEYSVVVGRKVIEGPRVKILMAKPITVKVVERMKYSKNSGLGDKVDSPSANRDESQRVHRSLGSPDGG